MIELIFVIVILGILAAVAIPKLSATRNDAKVSKTAHMIAAAANEIASYAVSKGTIQNDLSLMSNSVEALANTGQATLQDKEVWFHMGDENQCLQFVINDGDLDANLSLTLNELSPDTLCNELINMFDKSDYPIPLKGRRVRE